MRPWLQRTLDSLHPARSGRKIQRSQQQQRVADRAARRLALYHFHGCPYCLATGRAIDRLNINIALRDIHQDTSAYDELVAGGGRQTVPCLRIDDGERGMAQRDAAQAAVRSGKPRRRHVMAMGLACALLTSAAMAAPATERTIGIFTPGALADWEDKAFEGKTQYRLVGDGATRALEASCDGTASAIARRTSVDLSRTPVLRWQWRIDHVYAGLDGTTQAGDDYAARVYVIHDGGVLVWRTRAINYVWANSQPRGRHWPNAFTDKAMMVAVQSGPPANAAHWISESRNVRRDFKRYYGLDLDNVDGVALMTDCDNSGRSGRAEYRNIRFTDK